MSADTFTLLVADSSRLGTHLLEKILAPLCDMVVCRDDAALETALQETAGTRACLLSYQWSGLEKLLDQQLARVPVLLLASPDSDASQLATLTEKYGTGIIYRPYEPKQVIREVIHAILREQAAQASAEAPAPEQDITEQFHPQGTEIIRGGSPGLTLLDRDLAFCRRHHLSMSVLSVRLHDMESLARDMGLRVAEQAEQAVMAAIIARLRAEDSVVLSEKGGMSLTLPGTPPLGARVLAHRICSWLNENELAVGEFHVQCTVGIGIHSLHRDSVENASDFLMQSRDACLAANANHRGSAVHLSDVASEMAIAGQRPETPADAETLDDAMVHEDAETVWETLESMLVNEAQDHHVGDREEQIRNLTRLLRRLGEHERLQLVDELLLASALPE